jgi:hypothetical protein
MKYSKTVCYRIADTAEGREMAEEFKQKLLVTGYSATVNFFQDEWYVVGMLFDCETEKE